MFTYLGHIDTSVPALLGSFWVGPDFLFVALVSVENQSDLRKKNNEKSLRKP